MRIFIRLSFYEYFMTFERSTLVERVGKRAGFLFAYFLFTTMLFLIMTVLGKLPASWSYFHVMGVTFLVVLAGFVARRFLG